jgi:hypothetical protein
MYNSVVAKDHFSGEEEERGWLIFFSHSNVSEYMYTGMQLCTQSMSPPDAVSCYYRSIRCMIGKWMHDIVLLHPRIPEKLC